MTTDPTAVSGFREESSVPGPVDADGSRTGALPGPNGETPDLPTLDAAVIGALAALGSDLPGFMDELVGDFVGAVQRHTSGMRRAILHGDADGVIFSAHSLKGSCGIIGARRMAALSRQVEEKAYAGGDEILPLIVRLELEYAAVRVALDAAITAAATPPRP